jgi:hypothetical protein
MSNLTFPDFKTASLDEILEWVKTGDLESVKNIFEECPLAAVSSSYGNVLFESKNRDALYTALRERVFCDAHDVRAFIEAHNTRELNDEDVENLKNIIARFGTGTCVVLIFMWLFETHPGSISCKNLKKTFIVMSPHITPVLTKV